MARNDSDFEVFVESCLELLGGVEQAVLDLERAGPTALSPIVDRLFRAAHSLKGDAATVGLASMADLAHGIENVLTALREREIDPTPAVVDALLAGFDALREFATRDPAAAGPDTAAVLSRLAALTSGAGPGRDEAGPGRAEEALLGRTRRIERIHVRARLLDDLVDRLGELSILHSRLAGIAAEQGGDRLKTAVEELGALGAALHNQALDMRLLPLSTLFSRLRRLVRELGNRLGKQVELAIEGEDLALDKGVLERLSAPIAHLVRNALDHGVETPAERERAGKPGSGRIRIAARQAGSEVRIEVADDGAGIDTESLFAKAVSLGLVAPDAVLAPAERLGLVFLPGLSTARRADDISGRGVGMDAVREAVLAMRGSIGIESEPGLGTTFLLRFPLSLAIMDCLRIAVAGGQFFVPLDHVEECLELPSGREGERSLPHRGRVLPLIRLREIFGLDGPASGLPLVVVTQAEGLRVGLVVDRILGQHQAVIKGLGRAAGRTQGVLGATVLEDGSLGLIVDAPGLVALALAEEAGRKGG